MKATSKSICSHCTKPYWGLCVHSLSISITAKFESWVALQKYPSNFFFRFWSYIFCTKWKQNVCTECCYSTSFNDWFLPFFQGEEYVAHRLWKIVAALSLSMEFSSRREQLFTRFQSNHVWEIWSSAILMIKAHKTSPIFVCNDHVINDT